MQALKLMKKGVEFAWDQACDEAFKGSYLINPPVLAAPVVGKSFILYARALDDLLGALLAHNNDEGEKVSQYYLSRMLVGAEHKYSLVEKECLALMYAVKNLRYYLLSNTLYVVSCIKSS